MVGFLNSDRGRKGDDDEAVMGLACISILGEGRSDVGSDIFLVITGDELACVPAKTWLKPSACIGVLATPFCANGFRDRAGESMTSPRKLRFFPFVAGVLNLCDSGNWESLF